MMNTRSQNVLKRFSSIPTRFSPYMQEEPELPVGSSGKTGMALLTFEECNGKTYLTRNYNQMPARVLHALYYDPHREGMPYIIFVNPTGGIVQGDRYEYEFRMEKGSEAFITENAATKIYKMERNYGSRETDIYLGHGSRLEYIPRENIAFAGSRWFQRTTFHLEGEARFFYSDIFCPGRIARGELWDFSVYASKMMIKKDGRPLVIDNILWGGENKSEARTLLGDRTFYLSGYWFSNHASDAKEHIEFGGLLGGATNMPNGSGIVVKALGDDLDELRHFQLRLWDLFRRVETGTPAPDLRMC